ncbi:MAG TPA: hypothetical protein VM925_15510 [Labilithrix sp.]|nr:hypothetical protein [Labilithrix sp.]
MSATEMSDLERELELEFEYGAADEEIADTEVDEDHEEEIADTDVESESESELEIEPYAAESADYAERFYELSLRELESDEDQRAAVNEILDDMEREYFFGGLLKKAGSALGKVAKRAAGPISGLVKNAAKVVGGNLKGTLGSLAQNALAAAIPGGGLILPALKSLGLGAGNGAAASGANGAAAGLPDPRDAWQSFAQLARDAFERAASGLLAQASQSGAEREIADPVVASTVATNALGAAMRAQSARARARTPSGGGGRVRRIRVRRGDRLLIEVV